MGARPAKEIWEAALGELQIQVSKPYYRTWLKKTVGLSYQDGQFIIGVPNTFVAEYLEQNQRSLIEKTLIGLTQRDTKVVFHINGRLHDSLSSDSAWAKSYTRQEEASQAQQVSQPMFNLKYTFDSFIVGSCNRLAHAAAVEVTKNPGHSYNPLFIYGDAGLGKTHLLHAIGHMALANHLQVLYVSTEQFTNEFVEAIRQRKTEEFRNKYRSVDMLLVDDFHFLSGKKQTEKGFLHTFNELHRVNRQIVITSDRPPKSMPLLEDRLRSRLEWGLIADIQPPDFEARLAILQAKAESKGTNVPSDVLRFIAEQVQHNIRELEGYLNRVIAYVRLTRAPLSTELAAQAIEGIAGKGSRSTSTTPSLVIEAVADNFHLATVDLKGRKRDKETALARRVAMYLIRQETNCSLAQIGEELGDRDPSAVTNACKRIASEIDANHYVRHKVLDIQKIINPKPKTR